MAGLVRRRPSLLGDAEVGWSSWVAGGLLALVDWVVDDPLHSSADGYQRYDRRSVASEGASL
jgi:hypothetical protein